MNPLPPPSTRQRRLCVCADDFGLDAGINKAVLMLLEQGVVTATSCMVTRHAWVPGARVLRDVPPGATDVGLHLDLTNVDGSHRESSLKQLVRQAYLGQLDAVRLAGRIAEQLDRFEQAMGRMPDYVDGHRHVHQLPGVREALVEVMIDRYGPRPPWLRSTRPGGMAASTVIKQQLIYGLGGGRLHSAAQMHSVPISRRLLDVYDFSPTPDRYLRLLEHWVTNCRDGDVLMCHPALTTSSADPIAAARAQEFFALRKLQRRMHVDGHSVDLMALSWHVQRSGLTG